jgi:AcrR family transcriptional regulator
MYSGSPRTGRFDGMTASEEAPARGLRADAERNRQAILAAAARVFATEGTDAPPAAVAREAGVGVGTLYRRFPNRDELVQAVMEDTMRRYADAAVEAADRAVADPWRAFAGYVEMLLREQAADPGFADLLIAPFSGSTIFAAEHARAFRASIRLIERARRAGVVRPDLEHADLFLATLANAGVARVLTTTRAAASERLARILLDAFRPAPDREPLPAVPPGLGVDRRPAPDAPEE